jgi:hypothetical protein
MKKEIITVKGFELDSLFPFGLLMGQIHFGLGHLVMDLC